MELSKFEKLELDEEKWTHGILEILKPAASFTSVLEPNRLPHVKSLGCVEATFTVKKDLSDNLKIGLFGLEGDHEARIRFSSASSRRQDDSIGDGRGMAIKVFLKDSPYEQDFLLGTEKVFFAKTAKDMLDFTMALTTFKGREGLEKSHPNMHRLLKASQEALRPPNPLAMTYFSQVPYLLGKNQAVKYSVKPCSQAPDLNLTGTLSEALRAHLKLMDVCFDFQVQVYNPSPAVPDTELIEDATIDWEGCKNPEVRPFETVATITIKQTEGPLPDCERMSFDPWHNLDAHRPIGVINRIRGQAYKAAAARRLLPKTQNQLTALMTIKEPLDDSVRELRKVMNDHSLANGMKLHQLGFVHSARFLIIGDRLAIITSFDFDFRDYINTFVDELGDLFDLVLKVMQDAPPTPVRSHREEFFAYIKRISIQPDLFYSRYPDLSVQNIVTMKAAWEKQQPVQGGQR
jgi:hypothetical protein